MGHLELNTEMLKIRVEADDNKYTYEQVLATQAEQIESKSNNTENIPEFGKILIKDGIKNNEIDFKLNVG